MNHPLLQQAIDALRGGAREQAARLLARLVQQEPENEQAWLWLSGVQDDQARAAYCLERVLALNPANVPAQQGLEWIRRSSQPARSEVSEAPTVQAPGPPTQLDPYEAPTVQAPRPPTQLDPYGPPLPARPPGAPGSTDSARRLAPAATQQDPYGLADVSQAPFAEATPFGAPRAVEQAPAQEEPPVLPAEVVVATPPQDLRDVLAAEEAPQATKPEPSRRSGLLGRLAGRHEPEASASASANLAVDVAQVAPEPEAEPTAQPRAELISTPARPAEGVSMTPAEALGYMLLLGAVLGLNATLWSAGSRESGTFNDALLLAGLATLIFALALLPAWGGMIGVLRLFGGRALTSAEATTIVGEATLPGFIAAIAFLCGVGRLILSPGLERPLLLLQLGLLAIALAAIPLSLYNRLGRNEALARGGLLPAIGGATLAMVLLGGLFGGLAHLVVSKL